MELSVLISLPKAYMNFKRDKFFKDVINKLEKEVSTLGVKIEEMNNLPLNTALSFWAQAANCSSDNCRHLIIEAHKWFTIGLSRYNESLLTSKINSINSIHFAEYNCPNLVSSFFPISSCVYESKRNAEIWQATEDRFKCELNSYLEAEYYIYKSSLGAAICSWHLGEYNNAAVLFDNSLSSFFRILKLDFVKKVPDYFIIYFACILGLFAEAFDTIPVLMKNKTVIVREYANYERINSFLFKVDEITRNQILDIKNRMSFYINTQGETL